MAEHGFPSDKLHQLTDFLRGEWTQRYIFYEDDKDVCVTRYRRMFQKHREHISRRGVRFLLFRNFKILHNDKRWQIEQLLVFLLFFNYISTFCLLVKNARGTEQNATQLNICISNKYWTHLLLWHLDPGDRACKADIYVVHESKTCRIHLNKCILYHWF